MKPRNITVIISLTTVSAVVSLLLINIVLTNHFIPGYDLANQAAANIGTVIGGVTAPIFTLLSAILVYMAFVKQTESNDNQRLKNDIDIVFLLFNQIEAEIRDLVTVSNITTTAEDSTGAKTKSKDRIVTTGLEAFRIMCDMYRQNNGASKRYGEQTQSNYINYILESYKSMFDVIEVSKIERKHKRILINKALNFYILKLRDPLRNLCFEIRNNRDQPSLETIDFFVNMEKKFDQEFNLLLFEKKEDLFVTKREKI